MPLPRCAPNRTRTRAANCAACRSARSTHFAALLLLTAAWPAGPALAAEYRATDRDGDTQVKVHLDEWKDARRSDRVVPVKLYIPASDKPCPVVIFSHGLGGTREGYEFLGRFWASHGYLSVHLQHAGSDDQVWKDVPLKERMEAMRRAATQPLAAVARPADVRFAIDTVLRLCDEPGSPLHRLPDEKKIGMAGHSFGAWTTLVSGGQTLVGMGGKSTTYADARIRALIPMSAAVPRDPETWKRSYATVKLPAMHMTGTLDDSPITTTTPADRLKPFEFCPGPAQGGGEQYLLNFDRGDHMIFAGRYAAALAKTPRELAERYHQHIRIATLAFLDAHLRGDGEALRWLQSPQGLAARLGADAQLRMKTASDAASAPSDASPLDRSPSPAAGGASATAPALP